MTDVSSKPVISVSNLEAWYGESYILQGLNFEVSRGEVVTFVGRNGAGKTTALRAIMGLLEKRSGNIELFEKESIRLKPEAIARLGFGYIPEERGIFSSLTVLENLRLPPVIGQGGFTEDELFKLFPNLLERNSAAGTKLSGGEQQMLAIARILRAGAKVLLMDEPTEGLAPVVVRMISRTMLELKRRGYTILLVEQNLRFAASMSDRYYVVENGRIKAHVAAESVSADVRQLESFVGV